jgi:hypothetical protein
MQMVNALRANTPSVADYRRGCVENIGNSGHVSVSNSGGE